MLGLCYVGVIVMVFWIYAEILGYLEVMLRLLAFWSPVAFTVELLSSYLGIT